MVVNVSAQTAEEDWQLMVHQLRLSLPDNLPDPVQDTKRPQNIVQKAGSKNWSDATGNNYTRSLWGNWSNYSEENAGPYPLPDPLILNNGKKVQDIPTWWKVRRKEILTDFATQIYGRIPANTPQVTFSVTSVDSTYMNGRVIRKIITGRIDNTTYPDASPEIAFELYVPAQAKHPVPLMVRVSSKYDVFPTAQNQPPGGLREVIEAGWAYANFNTIGVQLDNGAGLYNGIIGLMNKGKPRKPEEWGAIAAWSWGLSRALDYFETDASIDSKKIGIQGHSRCGKTALVAAAYDARWAIVFASCSGCMGASLEMRSWGENIDNVAGSGEYHWMAGNFIKYAGNWASMPVDAHELIALIAPRPVFITGGTQDQWADPQGEFLACVAADPVYKLLGKKGLGTSAMPAADISLIDGDIAFRYHNGGHTDMIDWPVFIEFARKYF